MTGDRDGTKGCIGPTRQKRGAEAHGEGQKGLRMAGRARKDRGAGGGPIPGAVP